MTLMTQDQTTTEIEKINGSIERWQRRLNRAVGAIKRLDAKRKRLVRKRLTVTVPTASPAAAPVEAKPAVDTDLPAFLDRRSSKSAADQAAADQILAERAEHKRQKALGRKARQKAERAGATKRMPLEGKAALAAIRSEP